ncbi:LLM class flavin-dependent oxidoreductase [Micromonospora sp. WMMD1102]|uniref:LLM class flavin-dependent oxidoreductase n=1 Tax=Micromonospora sp. WMMD1102 TaxID=3016105 RepID=UPI002414D467|nr:LLM class flavin-dependent oxidoreductase [Micromonospora sp. WMMD1102]MDG4790633.1 LLM class flavin-dependent oxidoreductase [Micromonospora sp. WMMD1102]
MNGSNAHRPPRPEMPAVGFVLGSSFHPAELIAVARAIEDNGFGSVWSTEDYFKTGGISGAAVVLGATRHLSVGTGLISTYARHPALTAMEAATLASAYPGRFRLGLGPGGLGWLDQQGIRHPRPVSHVRESARAVRALLAGEELSGEYDGHTFERVRLTFVPRQAPPILVGATGPRMTAITGEVADGLLLSVLSTPEFVRIQRGIIASTAGDAVRPISTFAFFALDESVDRARAIARPVLAAYLAETGGTVMTDAIGITGQLRRLLADGDAADLAADMPDSWVDRLVVCGDLDTCLERINEFGRAGSDEVALVPLAVGTLPEDIAKVGSALHTG